MIKGKRFSEVVLRRAVEAAIDDPNRVFFKSDTESLTYKELVDQCRELEHTLPAVKLLAIDQGYTSRHLAMMLACLSKSICYCPISQTLPRAAKERLFASLPFDLIFDDAGFHKPATAFHHQPLRPFDFDDLVYLLFTSGSAGHPKAVGINESNLSSFFDGVASILENYQVSETIFGHSRPSFDLGQFDIFYAILCQGTLVTSDNSTNLAWPSQVIAKNRITHSLFVPTVGRNLVNSGLLQKADLVQMKRVLFCGEALPTSVANEFRAKLPSSARLFNLYGPTEATIAVSVFEVTRADEFHNETIPIGRPFGQNTFSLISDPDTKDFSELVIAGPQVSSHDYLNSTPSHLSQLSPFSTDGRSRLYRTGDLVEINDSGNYVWRSRKDDQFKFRGFRIEPGEVEATIRKMGGIEIVVVGYSKKLDAVVAAIKRTHRSLDTVERELFFTDVQQFCTTNLPSVMIPTFVSEITDIPINQNGKIDRRALLDQIEIDHSK